MNSVMKQMSTSFQNPSIAIDSPGFRTCYYIYRFDWCLLTVVHLNKLLCWEICSSMWEQKRKKIKIESSYFFFGWLTLQHSGHMLLPIWPIPNNKNATVYQLSPNNDQTFKSWSKNKMPAIKNKMPLILLHFAHIDILCHLVFYSYWFLQYIIVLYGVDV